MSYFTKYNCYIIECLCSVTQSYLTLYDSWTVARARLLCPWNFPGKNTGVGCHFLLQGIFLTEESNPGLLHLLCWQVDALPLCHLEAHITENIYTHIYMIYIVKNSSTDYTGVKDKAGLMC